MVLKLQGLTVTYGFSVAVEDLSLELPPGKTLGLLGLNGAGKTSTIRAILGIVRPRKGQVLLFGGKSSSLSVRRKLGFAPEEGGPPDFLRVREYMAFVSAFHQNRSNKREVEDLLEWFELDGNKKISQCSKGMVRRVVLASAFLGEPELLILDEPLNGLDPLLVIKLRERLDDFRRKGGAVLYSSHILSEVERTCTEIAILSKGKLVYSAGLSQAIKEHGSVEALFAEKVARG